MLLLCTYLFVMFGIAESRICSNDTRSGLPVCTGTCPTKRTCVLSASGFDCHPGRVNNYFIEDLGSIEWHGVCIDTTIELNLTEFQHFDEQFNTTGAPFENGVHLIGDVANTCDECYNSSCNGNLWYCALSDIVWGGCDLASDCYCTLLNGEEHNLTVIGKTKIEYELIPVCFGNNYEAALPVFREETQNYSLGTYDWDARGTRKVMNKRSTLANSVSLDWKQPYLEVFTSSPGVTNVFLSKTNLNRQLVCDQTENTFTIDDVWLETTESIQYQAYINTTLITAGSLSTRIVVICPVPDCFACTEFAIAFGCFTPTMKAVVILCVIALALLILLLLILIIMIVKNQMSGITVNANLSNMSGTVSHAVVIYLALSSFGVGACNVPIPPGQTVGFPANALSVHTAIPAQEIDLIVAGQMPAVIDLFDWGKIHRIRGIFENPLLMKDIETVARLYRKNPLEENYTYFAGARVPLAIALYFYFMIMTKKNWSAENESKVHRDYAIRIALLCAMLGVTEGCDVGFTVDSNHFVCTDIGESRSCILTEEIQVTIPLPGYDVCYDLYNLDTNLIDGRLIVTYIHMRQKATLNLKYWTSGWYPLTESHSFCPGNSQCTTGNDCNTERSGQNLITMNGTLSGPVTLLPGSSFCISSPGCAGYGCLICAEKCIKGRGALAPIGAPWKVMEVTTVSNLPGVNICLVQNDGLANCNQLDIDRPTPINMGNTFVTVEYVGSLVGETTYFGNKNIVMLENGINAYFCDAALAGVATAGAIGDVQGATAESFKNPTPTSFIFDPTIIQAFDSGENSILFTFQRQGILQGANCPGLPTTLGSTLWGLDGNSGMIGINGNPGPIQLNVRITNHTFISVEDQIKPNIRSLGITGSYLADQGATWKILAWSSLSPGSCRLSTNDPLVTLNTPSLRLTEAEEIYYVNMTVGKKSGIVTITCRSGEFTDNAQESYSLEEPHTVIDPNGTVPIIVPGTPNSNSGGVNFTLGQWIGFSIGTGLGSLLVIGLIVLIVLLAKGNSGYQIIDKIHDKFSSTSTHDSEKTSNGEVLMEDY